MKSAEWRNHWQSWVLIFAFSLMFLGHVRALPEVPPSRGITSVTRSFSEAEQRAAALSGEEQIHQEAEALYAKLGPTASKRTLERAILLVRQGETAAQPGERRIAIAALEEAAKLFRAERVPVEEAKVFRRLGTLYQSLGDSARSLIAYQKALEIFRKNSDTPGTAGTLNDLGGALCKLGRYDEALQVLQKGLELHQTLGSPSAEAANLENLGLISATLGDYPRAKDYFLKTLALCQSIGDSTCQARSLVGLGNVYIEQGGRTEARKALERAYKLQEMLNDQSAETLTLLALGNLALSNHDYWNGRGFFDKILAMPAVEEATRAQALVGAGSACSMLGDFDRARSLYEGALQLQHRSGDRSGEAQATFGLARVERQRGNLEEALRLSTEALDLIESLRSTIPGPRLRASFLATHHDIFALQVEILMDLAQLNPGGGYEVAAFEASERARARSLLDLLADSQMDTTQEIAPSLLGQKHALKRSLAEWAQARQEGQKDDADPNLRKALDSFEAVQMEIRAQRRGYAELRPPLVSWHELAEILDPDSALLEYSLGPERSFLWVVTRDSVTSFGLPPEGTIEALARKAFEYLSNGDQRMDAAAADLALSRLSRILLAPTKGRLYQKRLAIVADGALQYIPFAALPSPDHPELPLIVEHEIVSLPSASVLAALRNDAANRSVAPKTVAVVADPVFSSTDNRVNSTAPRASQQETATAALRSALDFARLPYSRTEAEAILHLVPDGEGSAFLDFGANRKSVIAGELSKYRIIHFATHAVIDATHPNLSGIVLSLVDRSGHPQLGFLGLPDIYSLRLNADLVVLSACRSALGREVYGEGLVGLTQSFYYAGARSVLSGLWGANDRSTSELMQRFYRVLLEQGLPPSAALRSAQISMLQEPRFRSPYYWAGFILQGDWRQERPFLGTSHPSAMKVASP